jgi:hypothetical protein
MLRARDPSHCNAATSNASEAAWRQNSPAQTALDAAEKPGADPTPRRAI